MHLSTSVSAYSPESIFQAPRGTSAFAPADAFASRLFSATLILSIFGGLKRRTALTACPEPFDFSALSFATRGLQVFPAHVGAVPVALGIASGRPSFRSLAAGLSTAARLALRDAGCLNGGCGCARLRPASASSALAFSKCASSPGCGLPLRAPAVASQPHAAEWPPLAVCAAT